jgi:hypothetical protein
VRRAAGEERPGRRAAEPLLHALAGLQADEAEAAHEQRVTRDAHGTQDVGEERLLPGDERRHQVHPSASIRAEVLGHVVEAAGEHAGGAVVQRVRKWHGRRQPSQAVTGQVQASKDG